MTRSSRCLAEPPQTRTDVSRRRLNNVSQMAGKQGIIRFRRAHQVAHPASPGRSLTALCSLFMPPVPPCTQGPSVSVSRSLSVSPPDRVWRPAAEAEGPHPGRHPQHQRGEAAPPGRSRRRRRLGLEEAAPLLHASRQMLRHTHGRCAVQLHVRVPGVCVRVCRRGGKSPLCVFSHISSVCVSWHE